MRIRKTEHYSLISEPSPSKLDKYLLQALFTIVFAMAAAFASTDSSMLGDEGLPGSRTGPQKFLLDSSMSGPYRIYCTGELLHFVQTLKIFPDGKSFVDMPMKEPADVVSQAFAKRFDFPSQTGEHEHPSPSQLREFVDEYFWPAGKDVEACTPLDWVSNPPLLSAVQSRLPQYLSMSQGLNGEAAKLCRRTSAWAKENPQQTSALPVPHNFVVPGGRFGETYYWDTYWTIKGLVSLGMVNTAKGCVENLLYLKQQYGFVPNGARIYYLNRSQPPMLPSMVQVVLSAMPRHSRAEWLNSVLPVLIDEHTWFMKHRSVNLRLEGSSGMVTLNRYNVENESPRPESYNEDVETAAAAASRGESNTTIWSALASGAESGWDFSSRWFSESDPSMRQQLSSISTNSIVPVCLNAILLRNERIISELAAEQNNAQISEHFHTLAMQREETMRQIMWSDEKARWQDVELLAETRTGTSGSSVGSSVFDFRRREGDYLSSFYPLWAGASIPHGFENKLFSSMQASGFFGSGGVQTSSGVPSGQQWDTPNAWPPLQEILHSALLRHGKTEEAAVIRDSYLKAMAFSWKNNGTFFEKYLFNETGKTGHGGEYVPQDGFGWTIGVAATFLDEELRAQS